MSATLAAWAGVVLTLGLNVVFVSYLYGTNKQKVDAMKELIQELESRMDRIQADIREIRMFLMKGWHDD